MSITLASLIRDLKAHAPMGLELPRDPDNNRANEAIIQRWAEDAAGAIKGARGKTTVKQVEITTTADVQDYALPADCRQVTKIERSYDAPGTSGTVLGVPMVQGTVLGYGNFGHLPSGQEISGSLDLINRQRLARMRREDEWELFNGELRLEFPTVEGETIRVTYRAIDRSFDDLPDDYFTPILTYLRWQNLEQYIDRHGASVAQDGDRLVTDRLATYNRQARALEDRWMTFLNGITQEV